MKFAALQQLTGPSFCRPLAPAPRVGLRADHSRMSIRSASMRGGAGRGLSLGLAIIATMAINATAGVASSVTSASAESVKVAEGVYALRGTGGEISAENRGRVANVAFVVGTRGVVVVDTGISYREGEDILAAVKSVSSLPVVLAILTHPGQEAIFGAAAFQARGIPVLAHRAGAELIAARCETCLANLRSTLREALIAGTRVITPDRLIQGNETIDTIGRKLRIIAPDWSSSPGAIAVFDENTSTLIARTLVSIRRVPDLRDANPKGSHEAPGNIVSMRCRHLIPSYGPIGSCDDVVPLVNYLDQLERHMTGLIKEGVGLSELRNRVELPQFAGWDQYDTLHLQNANRTYLRIERSQFD